MSRRFVVLALAIAAGITAGAALAKPPVGPQPDPELNPSPASLCAQYPHPTATCSAVAVSCPSSARRQVACTTVASVGPADATVQKLELQLPRRYASLAMRCRSDAKPRVACRILGHTSVAATGMRVRIVRLPDSFVTLRIGCATTGTKFACTLVN